MVGKAEPGMVIVTFSHRDYLYVFSFARSLGKCHHPGNNPNACWASGGLAARDSNVSLVADSVQLLLLSLFAFVRIRWRNILRPKSVFFWPKKTDTYLGKRKFFFCTTFPVRGQIMVSIKNSTLFWAQKLGFRPKSPIFAMRPQILSKPCL